MKSIFFLVGIIASLYVHAQNRILVDITRAKDTISRHIYGHFAEHLGRCIYDGFYVGEKNTTIPHINGVRKDVVAALRNLKIPNLRWPGGCFADTYHWKDGIGPKLKRPKIVNVWWGGLTEDNSFGTHEFLNMCELLDTEPYLSGNVGSGTVQELSDWINYTTFSGESPMSKLRRENGRNKPWNVKYWGVGNEAWGCGGNMRAEYYADEYRKYATFMGGNIFRIASGAAGSDYNWTEVLMKNVPHHLLEGVALHHYAVIDWNKKGPSFDFTEEHYFATMRQALFMDTLIINHTSIMDKYDPAKKVALVVDEWGGWYDVEKGTNPGFLFRQNTMRDAMIAGATLNIFNNHADRVRMANLAQTINVLQAVILTEGKKMLLTPTYHVMEMYKVHQDALMIPTTVKSDDYVFDNKKLPSISASVSRSRDGKVHITLTNIHAHRTLTTTIELNGVQTNTITGRILKSDNLQDHNSFSHPDKIKPERFENMKLNGNTLSVTLPPFSVVALQLQ